MWEVTLLNITKVQYCRWPPCNVTSIELLEAEDPDDLWNSFKIKILDDKIYGMYNYRVYLIIKTFIRYAW